MPHQSNWFSFSQPNIGAKESGLGKKESKYGLDRHSLEDLGFLAILNHSIGLDPYQPNSTNSFPRLKKCLPGLVQIAGV